MEEKKEEIVVADKFKFTDLYKKEDWQAIWVAFILILFSAIGTITGLFDFSGAKFGKWAALGEEGASFLDIFSWKLLGKWIITLLSFGLLFMLGNKLQNKNAKNFIIAFFGLFVLTSFVRILSSEILFSKYLEYAFWALLLGLLIANIGKGTPSWLKPALQTEFYIKTGLVIMGAEVLFTNIQKFGLYGLGIAWVVTPIVIIFMWWLGTKKLKIQNKSLVITIAAATSVCGTSAAIAAAAACRAKKTDLAFAVGISLIFTVIMMVGMPLFIQAIGMDPMIGGAWIGGTVDSTGAVVLAGQALGDLGGTVAALVKMIQNILIGFIAFAIAIFFTTKVEKNDKTNVGAGEIWQRFPKFILGFLFASLFFSFVLQPTIGEAQTADVIKHLGQFKNWAFALAFTSIGLETNFKNLTKEMNGGQPVTLYIVGQVFNIVLTFFVVWLLLSGNIFPVPEIDLIGK